MRLTDTELTLQQLTKPGHAPGFVLLIAPSGSYRIAPYLEAAKTLGLRLMVVSNSEHSLVPEVATGITVDFDQQAQARTTILSAISTIEVLCVIATDDSCVALCSQIAQHLNLPHNKPAAAMLTQRKDLARQALQQAGCNTPEFQVITIDQAGTAAIGLHYPVVIKPLSLSASRGVIRANNAAEFTRACARIDNILQQTGQRGFVREHLLVEAYLDGAEFAVEGFMVKGEFKLLTIFDKPEPLVGPYFEETYYLTPSQLAPASQAALVAEVARCCTAYGLEHGPIHAEARITSQGVVLLELAARTIGGQCGQLIEFSLQQKLEELVISGMCGFPPKRSGNVDAAGVLMIPVTSAGILKRVEGITAALQLPYIEDIEIHIQPGYELVPLPEGASYLGFIFAQGPDYQQTYAALKAAYDSLSFITRPVWKLDQLGA